MLSLEPTARILIVRLSAIGDVMHALPMIAAVREALPQAFLAWLVEGRTADLLRSHRGLDELIVVPRRWLRSPRTVLDLRRKLHALEFDVSIDVQGLSKSAIAAWLSGARRRIGLGGPDGREISPWLNNEWVVPQRAHIVERNLELLGPLGISPRTVRFDLDDSAVDRLTAAKILESLRLPERFAIINPGAGWPSKLWPPDRYAAVARYLGQQRSLRSLVVWAGAQEHVWGEAIVAGSAGYAQLAPATNLTELAAIARRATIFVSSDSGPLHVAAAVGTLCVGLFGPMPAERNGPYGAHNVTVQKMRLGGTSHSRRTAGPESMAAISVSDVTCACDQVLGRRIMAGVNFRPLKESRPAV
jgi:lipopolysaccharide heptosyltransferase I